MLFRLEVLPRIESGEVTVAFRRWKRPTVVAGGTLQSGAGLLAIDEVGVVEEGDITPEDLVGAGATSVEELLEGLRAGEDRKLYRVRFHRIGEDPRIALRQRSDLEEAERAEIDAQLARWDAASRSGPWTRRTLEVIHERPGVVAAELAQSLGEERLPFKRRVRQLKSLGLTESLPVGYRLSPRGEAYLDQGS